MAILGKQSLLLMLFVVAKSFEDKQVLADALRCYAMATRLKAAVRK